MKKNIFKTLAVTVLSAVSLTAWAVDPYAGLVNTTTEITFDGKTWYLIEDNSTAANAGTVTLLTKECVAASQYNPDYSSGNTYSGSTVETTVKNYYTNSISDAVKSAVVGGGMFLLTKEQANAMTSDTRKCSKYSGTDVNAWWLCSAGNTNFQVWSMYSEYAYATINPVNTTLGVRPALKLDLSKVTFDSATKTFTVGSSTETYTVTWKSQDGTVTYETDTDVAKDAQPSYDGSAPTKAEDENYTYTFAGWATSANQESGTAASALPAVTDNVTYYAAFSKTQKQSSTAYDDLNANNTTVQIEGVKIGDTIVDWYVIDYNSTDQTVTLLSKQSFASKVFNSDWTSKGNDYVGSDIEAYLKGLIGDGQPLAGIKDALADINGKVTGNPNTISGAVPYLLSYDEANVLSETKRKCGDGIWWLRSKAYNSYDVAYVDGETGVVHAYSLYVEDPFAVRPALQLDLSKVTFDTETKTFSVAPTTSVATPTLSPADAVKSNIWYDLNGRHYQGKPTMPGVYINNRQKYVVK